MKFDNIWVPLINKGIEANNILSIMSEKELVERVEELEIKQKLQEAILDKICLTLNACKLGDFPTKI